MLVPVAEALDRGRELYNVGRFWEAHDAWEEAWLLEDGDAKRLLQGLIQITAAYHNAFVRRRPGSVVKLLTAGLAKLDGIPDELAGLALVAFRVDVARSVEDARRWHQGGSEGLDRGVVPRLRAAPR